MHMSLSLQVVELVMRVKWQEIQYYLTLRRCELLVDILRYIYILKTWYFIFELLRADISI